MLYFIRRSTISNRFAYNCYHVGKVTYSFIQDDDILLKSIENIKVGDIVYLSGNYKWKKFE